MFCINKDELGFMDYAINLSKFINNYLCIVIDLNILRYSIQFVQQPKNASVSTAITDIYARANHTAINCIGAKMSNRPVGADDASLKIV